MLKLKTFSIIGIAVGSFIVIATAIVGWCILPTVIEDKIKDKMRLTNPEILEKWSKPDIPIQMKVYVYNYTNPENLFLGKKLKVEQLGPYVYDIRIERQVNISRDKVTASYRNTMFFSPNEGDTKGSEDDIVTVPNLPIISLAHIGVATMSGTDKLDGVELFMDMLRDDEDILKKNVSIGEYLFSGWPLHEAFELIPAEMIPPEFKSMKFALFMTKNGTLGDKMEILTGDKNPSELGKVVSWKDKEELDFWPTPGAPKNSSLNYCNRINGTDGSLFSPFVTKETVLRLFQPDLCRSIHLVYDSETTFKKIPGYKFVIGEDAMAAPICQTGNRCYCQRQSKFVAHQCWQQTQRLYPCALGAPLVLSNARFFGANDEVFDYVKMKRPSKDLHESYMIIEPLSGAILKASIKVQMNVELQRLKPIKPFKYLNFSRYTDDPSILLPLVWMEQGAEIDDKSAKMMYDLLVGKMEKLIVGKWILVILGGIIAFASTTCLIASLRKKEA